MTTRLVLLGAGDAHVEVLRRLARARLPGLETTIVAREADALCSAMLPALLRREVTRSAAGIDVAALARRARAGLVVAEARSISFAPNAVLADGAVIRFDLLSIDVGGAPFPIGAGGIPVKPISRFLARLPAIEADLAPGSRVAVIGGGAGGVELALALAARWGGRVDLVLVCGTQVILPGAPEAARRIVHRALAKAGVEIVAGAAAGDHVDGHLALADGTLLPADLALWATGIAAPAFLARSGLACDAQGCVRVDQTLTSVSHNDVFAADDCAAVEGTPRPEGSVRAVSAGPVLANNLIAAIVGRPLDEWKPRPNGPVTLGIGNGRAVTWRGRFTVAGRLAAHWKCWTDRRWLRRYPRPG